MNCKFIAVIFQIATLYIYSSFIWFHWPICLSSGNATAQSYFLFIIILGILDFTLVYDLKSIF